MSDCIEFKGHRNLLGYGKIKRDGKVQYAHRYFYEQEHGPIPAGMIVCHTCDNPSCINTDHLFLGTHQDNSDDKLRKGRNVIRCQRGENNANAKLTKNNVIEIRKLINEGMNNTEIAKIFNVHHGTISNIRLGKTWT